MALVGPCNVVPSACIYHCSSYHHFDCLPQQPQQPQKWRQYYPRRRTSMGNRSGYTFADDCSPTSTLSYSLFEDLDRFSVEGASWLAILPRELCDTIYEYALDEVRDSTPSIISKARTDMGGLGGRSHYVHIQQREQPRHDYAPRTFRRTPSAIPISCFTSADSCTMRPAALGCD
jgi:hypothetical protein